jgi:hypothetical protein
MTCSIVFVFAFTMFTLADGEKKDRVTEAVKTLSDEDKSASSYSQALLDLAILNTEPRPDIVPIIKPFLTHETDFVRVNAWAALCKHADERSVPDMIAFLDKHQSDKWPATISMWSHTVGNHIINRLTMFGPKAHDAVPTVQKWMQKYNAFGPEMRDILRSRAVVCISRMLTDTPDKRANFLQQAFELGPPSAFKELQLMKEDAAPAVPMLIAYISHPFQASASDIERVRVRSKCVVSCRAALVRDASDRAEIWGNALHSHGPQSKSILQPSLRSPTG